MSSQHQDSLLPADRQGEEGHETTNRSGDVSVNRVSHAADIHLPHPLNALRAANTGREQGG